MATDDLIILTMKDKGLNKREKCLQEGHWGHQDLAPA